MPAVVEAAWDLQRHLFSFSEGDDPAKTLKDPKSIHQYSGGAAQPTHPRHETQVISRPLQHMTAVQTRHRYLLDLKKVFLHKATDYLEAQLRSIADEALETVSALPSSERLRPLSHTGIHQRARHLGPLYEVVVAMRPGAASPMIAQYCKSMNGLLRKEVSVGVKELQKKIAAADALVGTDAELSLKHADSLK